jgi:hypothetical protein
MLAVFHAEELYFLAIARVPKIFPHKTVLGLMTTLFKSLRKEHVSRLNAKLVKKIVNIIASKA